MSFLASARRQLHERRQIFRERMRPVPGRPARVWLRAQWPWVVGLVLAILGTAAFDAWLGTCGFNGCPTGSEIRAFRPPEGGRILDRSGRFIGRMTNIRRVNVPIADVPEHV